MINVILINILIYYQRTSLENFCIPCCILLRLYFSFLLSKFQQCFKWKDVRKNKGQSIIGFNQLFRGSFPCREIPQISRQNVEPITKLKEASLKLPLSCGLLIKKIPGFWHLCSHGSLQHLKVKSKMLWKYYLCVSIQLQDILCSEWVFLCHSFCIPPEFSTVTSKSLTYCTKKELTKWSVFFFSFAV